MRIDDEQRRARLVARHHLGRTASDVVDAVRAVAAVHSSDPLTPHLAMWARVPGFAIEDLDHALYEERSLWRLHAMRRTLFVVAADEQPVFDAAASRDVAAKERARVAQWLGEEMPAKKVKAWLGRVEKKLLAVFSDGELRRAAELSEAVPELATEITLGSGKWARRAPLGSRLLYVLAMEGKLVRGPPAGSWRSSQYHWASVDGWFEAEPDAFDDEAGRTELARRYLATHGPATLADLRWWTGWTAARAKRVLRNVGAVEVELEGGSGFVLEDDREPVEAPDDTVAFLPGLDPTPMGYKERRFFVGEHANALFDRNGNIGPTVWLGGRIVGGWAQRPDGEVVVRILEKVARKHARRIHAEAAALTEWLDGEVAIPRFRTPLERELSG